MRVAVLHICQTAYIPAYTFRKFYACFLYKLFESLNHFSSIPALTRSIPDISFAENISE